MRRSSDFQHVAFDENIYGKNHKKKKKTVYSGGRGVRVSISTTVKTRAQRGAATSHTPAVPLYVLLHVYIYYYVCVRACEFVCVRAPVVCVCARALVYTYRACETPT